MSFFGSIVDKIVHYAGSVLEPDAKAAEPTAQALHGPVARLRRPLHRAAGRLARDARRSTGHPLRSSRSMSAPCSPSSTNRKAAA